MSCPRREGRLPLPSFMKANHPSRIIVLPQITAATTCSPGFRQQFQLNLPENQRSSETEKIRLNVNYVLVSWYPDQCPGETPNWPWVFGELASILPNSKVGFGELGTANPKYGSCLEIDEITQYHPMS